jgi:hypothetical protein
MASDARHSARLLRFLRAVALAPIAAPFAILTGTVTHILADARPLPPELNSVSGIILICLIVFVFGVPLSYGSTVLILWPAAVMLEKSGHLEWWSLTAIGAVAGALLLPAYLHLLSPRGTWEFFPGAGFVAGALTALVFWSIVTQPESE